MCATVISFYSPTKKKEADGCTSPPPDLMMLFSYLSMSAYTYSMNCMASSIYSSNGTWFLFLSPRTVTVTTRFCFNLGTWMLWPKYKHANWYLSGLLTLGLVLHTMHTHQCIPAQASKYSHQHENMSHHSSRCNQTNMPSHRYHIFESPFKKTLLELIIISCYHQ